MADIQSFKAELISLLGYVPEDANAKELLIRACYDVVNRFKKVNPVLLDEFAIEIKLTDGTGYDMITNFVYAILGCTREDYSDSDRLNRCQKISALMRGQAGDSDSIYAATAHSPVYYILNGTLAVLPVPDTDNNAVVSLVKFLDTVTNYDYGVSTIDGYPESYNHFIILYAAYHLLLEKIVGYADDADVGTQLTAATTSITKLAAIITSMGTSASAGDTLLDGISWSDFATAIADVTGIIDTASIGWDAWITAEDPELSQATMQGIQARIGEAQAQIAKIGEIIKQAGTYATINQSFVMQADVVNKEITGNLQWVQSRLAEMGYDISVYKANATALNDRYEKLFVPYAQAEERRSGRR